MATLTIEVPNNIANRILGSYCGWHGESANLAFMKSKIIDHIIEMVRNYEVMIAIESLKQDIRDKQDDIEQSRFVISQDIDENIKSKME